MGEMLEIGVNGNYFSVVPAAGEIKAPPQGPSIAGPDRFFHNKQVLIADPVEKSFAFVGGTVIDKKTVAPVMTPQLLKEMNYGITLIIDRADNQIFPFPDHLFYVSQSPQFFPHLLVQRSDNNLRRLLYLSGFFVAIYPGEGMLSPEALGKSVL